MKVRIAPCLDSSHSVHNGSTKESKHIFKVNVPNPKMTYTHSFGSGGTLNHLHNGCMATMLNQSCTYIWERWLTKYVLRKLCWNDSNERKLCTTWKKTYFVHSSYSEWWCSRQNCRGKVQFWNDYTAGCKNRLSQRECCMKNGVSVPEDGNKHGAGNVSPFKSNSI